MRSTEKMVKMKGDKFLGIDKNGNKWQIFIDGGINILNIEVQKN